MDSLYSRNPIPPVSKPWLASNKYFSIRRKPALQLVRTGQLSPEGKPLGFLSCPTCKKNDTINNLERKISVMQTKKVGISLKTQDSSTYLHYCTFK